MATTESLCAVSAALDAGCGVLQDARAIAPSNETAKVFFMIDKWLEFDKESG